MSKPMERFVYLNGLFFDRVSNNPYHIAKSLKAELVAVNRFYHSVCGWSERVELVTDNETSAYSKRNKKRSKS